MGLDGIGSDWIGLDRMESDGIGWDGMDGIGLKDRQLERDTHRTLNE